MTIPPNWKAAPGRVTDMVRNLMPFLRRNLSDHEQALLLHLRGNEPLFDALKGLIESRIGVRASASVPSDPIQCKAILERDSELRWLLARLEFIYRSPFAQPTDEGEPPA